MDDLGEAVDEILEAVVEAVDEDDHAASGLFLTEALSHRFCCLPGEFFALQDREIGRRI